MFSEDIQINLAYSSSWCERVLRQILFIFLSLFLSFLERFYFLLLCVTYTC